MTTHTNPDLIAQGVLSGTALFVAEWRKGRDASCVMCQENPTAPTVPVPDGQDFVCSTCLAEMAEHAAHHGLTVLG